MPIAAIAAPAARATLRYLKPGIRNAVGMAVSYLAVVAVWHVGARTTRAVRAFMANTDGTALAPLAGAGANLRPAAEAAIVTPPPPKPAARPNGRAAAPAE